jgi:hypothetical protein
LVASSPSVCEGLHYSCRSLQDVIAFSLASRKSMGRPVAVVIYSLSLSQLAFIRELLNFEILLRYMEHSYCSYRSRRSFRNPYAFAKAARRVRFCCSFVPLAELQSTCCARSSWASRALPHKISRNVLEVFEKICGPFAPVRLRQGLSEIREIEAIC